MLAYCSDGAADATTVYEAALCAARAAERAAIDAKAESETACTMALAAAMQAAAEGEARAETAEVRLGAAVQDAVLTQHTLASERQEASRRHDAQEEAISKLRAALSAAQARCDLQEAVAAATAERDAERDAATAAAAAEAAQERTSAVAAAERGLAVEKAEAAAEHSLAIASTRAFCLLNLEAIREGERAKAEVSGAATSLLKVTLQPRWTKALERLQPCVEEAAALWPPPC